MKDPMKVKELILEKLDLAEVMLEYGTSFVFHPGHVDEVQFRCPFHGKDKKPSARFYRQTKSCYCWYCRKTWDVIEFIKDKENLTFYQCLNHIIKKYRIDVSSIPDDPEFTDEKKKKISDIDIRISCVHKALLRLRGKMEFEKYNILCVYFLSTWYRKKEKHEDVKDSLSKLEDKIAKAEQCQ